MRLRATVLLTRHHAVLLVRERGGPWQLPGAAVEMNELAMVAAVRALHRDTGVEASAAAFMFQQISAQHLHNVYRIAIPDDVDPYPNPLGNYDELRWIDSSQLGNAPVTPGTRAILNRAMGPSDGGGGGAVDDSRASWRPNGLRSAAYPNFRKR